MHSIDYVLLDFPKNIHRRTKKVSMEFLLTQLLREAVRNVLKPGADACDEADALALQRYLREDARTILLTDVRRLSHILRQRAASRAAPSVDDSTVSETESPIWVRAAPPPFEVDSFLSFISMTSVCLCMSFCA